MPPPLPGPAVSRIPLRCAGACALPAQCGFALRHALRAIPREVCKMQAGLVLAGASAHEARNEPLGRCIWPTPASRLCTVRHADVPGHSQSTQCPHALH